MCEICLSSLLDDVNKKVNWRPDRVIKWAGRRGLVISEKQLEEHFEKHVDSATVKKSKSGKTVQGKKKTDSKLKKLSAKPNTHKEQSVSTSEISDGHITADNKLLSEVISQVLSILVEGGYDLKIEHGFKAVELKHKLSDNSDSETLLLDLLNEIRRQELELNR